MPPITMHFRQALRLVPLPFGGRPPGPGRGRRRNSGERARCRGARSTGPGMQCGTPLQCRGGRKRLGHCRLERRRGQQRRCGCRHGRLRRDRTVALALLRLRLWRLRLWRLARRLQRGSAPPPPPRPLLLPLRLLPPRLLRRWRRPLQHLQHRRVVQRLSSITAGSAPLVLRLAAALLRRGSRCRRSPGLAPAQTLMQVRWASRLMRPWRGWRMV